MNTYENVSGHKKHIIFYNIQGYQKGNRRETEKPAVIVVLHPACGKGITEELLGSICYWKDQYCTKDKIIK